MTVELRHLRALVAVVDEGTFTDAAIALGTTQASVSRAVASFERALDVRLLTRTTRAVAPTEVGGRVLAHARQVLDEVLALERVVGDRRVTSGSATRGRPWASTPSRSNGDGPGATPAGRSCWSRRTPRRQGWPKGSSRSPSSGVR